jgi:hypothetical protein
VLRRLVWRRELISLPQTDEVVSEYGRTLMRPF